MKLIEQLVARAAAADAEMGQLADQVEAQEARRKAYDKVEQMFDQMAADGYLSKDELEALKKEFRAQGLDTAALDQLARELANTDGSTRVGVTTDLRSRIYEQLQDAEYATRDPALIFKTQELVTTYNQSFDLAGRVLKSEHEMYMTAIKHLVA
ncbi:hypothetical protein L6R52_15215 [Myxococcota bacterium]|nr:hypothetical protein [Myxococcota bacterium]